MCGGVAQRHHRLACALRTRAHTSASKSASGARLPCTAQTPLCSSTCCFAGRHVRMRCTVLSFCDFTCLQKKPGTHASGRAKFQQQEKEAMWRSYNKTRRSGFFLVASNAIHHAFDESLRRLSIDGVSVGAQAHHSGGSPMSQRECAGFNWPPLSILASEPVSISPEAVSRTGPHIAAKSCRRC